MTPLPLVLIRHGPTDWNAEGRIQGRSDRRLSAAGRRTVGRWQMPASFSGYRWVTSPLARARETAALLAHPAAVDEAALIEADWGEWEGQRIEDLRASLGEVMTRLEAQGLNFRPPGGESPRDLQVRLRPWLAEMAARRQPCVAVCHKGIIRALTALATGWDMSRPPPEKIRAENAHCFTLSAGGTPSVDRLNLRLLP